MHVDFNAELHARPSIYFSGMAYVEHLALRPISNDGLLCRHEAIIVPDATDPGVFLQIEFHTEFATVTRVTPISERPLTWPASGLSHDRCEELTSLCKTDVSCRVGMLVVDAAPPQLGPILSQYGFQDTAASNVGDGAAQICSDFRVSPEYGARIMFFNRGLNSYRLGRMVRRVLEIETYRCMALLGLSEARRLGPVLKRFDGELFGLTKDNAKMHPKGHRQLLDEINALSAHVISETVATRNRFGATAAYAQIVEERIAELRESHVPGFQRFGIFVARRFKPAVRTCAATALRLEQISVAAAHLLDLLQTKIQVEIEFQNARQLGVMAERAATQIQIQRAVEGFSVIAISYYLLSLIEIALGAAEGAGLHAPPMIILTAIPIVLIAVALAIHRVRHAIAPSREKA
ncbi:DUF3422 domain-containing protein [Rhizobium rhizogenes]|uniref:DUF3422 domain-containing protein n=1 Tax=Rhizobium rhizogenes TaxID=359 RepID=UPI0022715AE4|nr:DUF3422 domain-containing protein [Rhizobium rhizogenes]